MLTDVFVPTGHTLEDARRVMADCERFNARRQQPVLARAKATTAPPARAAAAKTPDATEAFFTAVGQTMDAKHLSKARAMRAVAISHPALHTAYLAEVNSQARSRDERKRQEAARALARRNSR